MSNQQVETAPDRLRTAVRALLAKAGRAGATTKEEREAAVALEIGWAVSSVQTWGGYKVKKTPGQLPHLAILLRFFEATGYSADHILFGTGPEKRATRKRGARLSRDELAAELAAHLATVVTDGQTMTIHCIDGREALRAAERATTADRDFLQSMDGGWIDREAAMLLRDALPKAKPSDRKDYDELAKFLKARAAGRRVSSVQQKRARDVRIVVDGDTLFDPNRPVYRASDRVKNGPPPWIVKVGQPQETGEA